MNIQYFIMTTSSILVIIYRLFVSINSMVRIQKRISDGLEVLQYFTTREWKFYNDKIIKIYNELSQIDKETFPTIIYDIDLDNYYKDIILGARQYCMKEDLSTLPKARRHQKM